MTDITSEFAPPPSAQRAQKTSNRFGWFVAFALSLGYLLAMIDRFLISITLEPMKAELNFTDTELGLLSGPAFALFYSIFGVPLGRLADLTDRCRLIGGAMLVWSLATAAIAFVHSFEGIFIARAIVGIGEAALVPAGTALLAVLFTNDKVGRPTSIFLAGASLGKSTAFIGGGALLAVLTAAGGMHFGLHFSPWQSLFLIASIPGAFLGILFLSLRDPGNGPKAAVRPPMSEAYRHFSTRKAAYILHICASACVNLSNVVLITWTPSFYTREFALSPAEAAVTAGIATLITAPFGCWLGGVIVDRLRRRGVLAAPVIMVGTGAAILVPSVLLFTLSGSLTASIIGYGLAMFSIQIAATPSLLGVQQLTPQRHRGLVVSVFILVGAIVAMGIGPVLTGAANDFLFEGKSLGFSILGVIAIVCSIGVLCSAIVLKPYAKAAADNGE